MSVLGHLDRRPGVSRGEADTRRPRAKRWLRRLRRPETLVDLAVVVVCVVFTFVELEPSKLFLDTTPAGGDMGAHVWLPAYVKAHLLPHLQVTGWTQDWYDGFPVLTYYFPLPIYAIALASYVIPYDIAFKLVSVAGLLTLPLGAYALGRLARMRFPGPACLAAATLPYLFSRDFTIYGGNIASTMAGEFCFSISLSFALVFLGLVARGLRTGRHRALAAVVLAACVFSHVLPAMFALGGAVVLWVLHGGRRRWRWTVPVVVVGGALTAVWSVPFVLDLPYATNMGYQKLTTYLASLFPAGDLWLFLLAGIGAVLALANGNRTGSFLTVMTVLCAVVFRIAPQGRLWNARVLPFWFLCCYLLAGVACCEAGCMLLDAFRRRWEPAGGWPSLLRPASRWHTVVPAVTVVVALIWVGYPLRILPGGHVTASGSYDWLGITSTDNSYIPDWVRWNYSGYQSSGKARRAEYFALVAKMAAIGRAPGLGCGRAMWEYEPQLDQMGTPDALMLLPYWTNGCIGSQEGLYYESSATTPYHFLDAAELSEVPANPVRGLDYPSGPDLPEGIAHLQMLGVKYYMVFSPQLQAQASLDPQLRLVGTVGPYPVTYTTGGTSLVKQRTWDIYEIRHSALVAPLADQPVVVPAAANPKRWLGISEAWWLDPADWNVVEVASGPASWARVAAGQRRLPRRGLPAVAVSHVVERAQAISFDVSRVGVPVVVRTSYFPNWQASGAGTPYRATPNLMVVVPTSRHVTLRYGSTPADWFALALTIGGLGATAGLLWLGPARYSGGGPGGSPVPGRRDPDAPGGSDGDDTDTDTDGARRAGGGRPWTRTEPVPVVGADGLPLRAPPVG